MNLCLYKVPGDLRDNVFHPGRGREHLTMSVNVFSGWILTGGLIANLGGQPRALGLTLTGESRPGNLFAKARNLHFLLMTTVPEDIQTASLTGVRPPPRGGRPRWTDAEWDAWRAQRQR